MASAQSVKLFVGVETDLAGLERRVNDWIRESRAEVLNIFGNLAPQTLAREVVGPSASERRFAPSDILLVVVYRPAGS